MDTRDSIAALVAEGPATGQTAGGWDCISRDQLRQWIAERRWEPETDTEVGFQEALDRLEAFINDEAW